MLIIQIAAVMFIIWMLAKFFGVEPFCNFIGSGIYFIGVALHAVFIAPVKFLLMIIFAYCKAIYQGRFVILGLVAFCGGMFAIGFTLHTMRDSINISSSSYDTVGLIVMIGMAFYVLKMKFGCKK